MTGTTHGVRIKTWQNSPTASTAANMTFENIVMNDVGKPILIDQEYCPYPKCDASSSMENRSPLTNLTKQKRNLSPESLSQHVKKDSKSIFGDLVNHDWEAVRYFLSSQVRPGGDVSRVYRCDLCSHEFPNAQAYGGHMSSHSKNKRSNGGTNNRRNKRSREASSCTSSTPIAKEGKKGKAMNVTEEGGKRSRAQPEVTIEEASSKLGDVEGEAHWMTFLNRDMAIL
ncbi:hypothetical protein HPP92_003833 [Vanilla planifolia]|uniref:C2H2-type domain-containing protein n=1 Tax=Vanilla planifolia TaxID=51239 RepID=A0A835S957_VANPL|nr:hypothetical protein HPP92_003833 [Vanilla planifolia]